MNSYTKFFGGKVFELLRNICYIIYNSISRLKKKLLLLRDIFLSVSHAIFTF